MILSLSSLPKTPSPQPIRADKTLLWQFGEDEDTIDEICGVHESIFTQQLGLQAPDDPKHRWLIIGSGIHRKCQEFGGEVAGRQALHCLPGAGGGVLGQVSFKA